jgi:hypothetical protein
MGTMRHFLSCLVFTAVLTSTSSAAEPASGNWKIVTISSPTTELVDSIISLEKKDGAWNVDVVCAGLTTANRPPVPLKLQSVSIQGDQIRIVGQRGNNEVIFEGRIEGPKKIVGNYGTDARIIAARLAWTEDTDIDAESSRIVRSLPEPMREYTTLQQGVTSTTMRTILGKTAEEKKKANEDLTEKRKELTTKGPPLLKQVLAEHGDHPVAFEAANLLIQSASQSGAKLDDVTKWTEDALERAAKFGPRFVIETRINLTETLAKAKEFRDYAIYQAKKADQELGPDGSTSRQLRILYVLVEALKNNAAVAKPYADRMEKLETKLDVEYLAKHAKFEVKPYEGRKNNGTKKVLMELFTGAQCPPCVAADIAFDKLGEAYKPADVILLQYHLHIPGPDPLTNSDTIARQKYYSVGSTPSTFFNGVAEARGGGGEAAAPGKLDQYRKIIDRILDEEGKGNLSLRAERNRNAIMLNAKISDLSESDEKVKLHFALVEESVRYVGSNGLRFHYRVVRALPGGAEGIELQNRNTTHQAHVDVADVRSNLTKYLDEFAASKPFPKPQRPMEMKKLKAVAWLQEVDSKAVVVAVETDVAGTVAGE